MSVAATRAAEVLGRTTEKHGKLRTLHGHHGPAHPGTLQGQVDGEESQHRRDDSPCMRTISRSNDSDTESVQSLLPFRTNGSQSELDLAEARPTHSSRSARAPSPLSLDVCPSFSEQRPEGMKPLFLDRHETLRRVHQYQNGEAVPTPRSEVADQTAGANSGDVVLNTAAEAPGQLQPSSYLPSWDIARSELWLLVEAALPKQPPSALESEALPDRALSMRAVPSTTTSASPFACRDTQFSITQQAPGLNGLFRYSSKCPATPRGMGPLPTLLAPSFTMASLSAARQGAAAHVNRAAQGSAASSLEAEREHFLVDGPGHPATVPEGKENTTGTDGGATKAAVAVKKAESSAGEEADDEVHELHHPHHRIKHHAAFAAGVAAATSTVAAVSQAASAAASALGGIAGLGSGPSLSSSAALLHLGTNVLNVGSSVLATKFQGPAVSKSTMTAAEVVLGPDAPPVLREGLRRRLRYAVAGVSVIWFLLNLQHTTDVLMHLDFEHDFVTSSKTVINLATSGPSLFKNWQELLQVGLAVTLGVGKRAMGAEGS